MIPVSIVRPIRQRVATRRSEESSAGGSVTACGAMLDPPTVGDRHRMRKARGHTRARLAEIEEQRHAEAVETFRAEVRATVRSASPLLVSLLAMEGLQLDEAVGSLGPSDFWPRVPRASGKGRSLGAAGHLLRFYMMGVRPSQLSEPPVQRTTFSRADGGNLTMQVVGHSLEVEARIGPVFVETRFGELRVEVMEGLPETIFTGCVGRTLETIVDHPAWRGRGWRVVGIEEPVTPYVGQTLVVAIGSIPYRLPGAPPLRARRRGRAPL